MSNSFSAVLTLGRDAEVKQLSSGTSVLSFSGACNTGYGDKKRTLWVRVSAFGKIAEGTLVNFLVKGQTVFCSGELSQSEYAGNDGLQKTSLEMISNTIELVGKKLDAMGDTSEVPSVQRHQSRPNNAPPQSAYDKLYGGKTSKGGENKSFDDFDDSVPF